MNILRLVRKDMLQQRGFLLSWIGFELASCEILFQQLSPRTPGAIPLVLLMTLGLCAGFVLCMRTVVSEEKNRAFFFLKTLPITNREIVIAKFAANALLLLISTGVTYAAYGIAVATGHLPTGAQLSAGFVGASLAFQLWNSFFFLSLALVLESDKAVWVPFPMIWVLVTLMANFRKIERALGLEGIYDALSRNVGVAAAGLALADGALIALTVALFDRRRRFG